MKFETLYNNLHEYDADDLETICMTLESLEDEDAEEIADLIYDLDDETCGDIVINKAIRDGIEFNADQIITMAGNIDNSILEDLIDDLYEELTDEQIEELEYYVDADVLKGKASNDSEDNSWDNDEPEKLGFFAKLFGAAAGAKLASGKQKDSGFRVGDRVRIAWSGMEGEVIDVSFGSVMVRNISTGEVNTYSPGQLKKIWF